MSSHPQIITFRTSSHSLFMLLSLLVHTASGPFLHPCPSVSFHAYTRREHKLMGIEMDFLANIFEFRERERIGQGIKMVNI